MAKKPATAEKQQTAETIIALVKALPQEERNRVFDFTNRHKENKAVSQLLELAFTALRFLDMTLTSAKKIVGNADAFRQRLVDGIAAEGVFEELRQQIEALQRKRSMSKGRIATAEVFEKLLKEKGKWDAALLKLVDEPGEKEKRYAQKYREANSYERLRNYIKAVMRDYRKHKARQSL